LLFATGESLAHVFPSDTCICIEFLSPSRLAIEFAFTILITALAKKTTKKLSTVSQKSPMTYIYLKRKAIHKNIPIWRNQWNMFKPKPTQQYEWQHFLPWYLTARRFYWCNKPITKTTLTMKARYVQGWTLMIMRFKFLMISITRCPH